jgi:hypothetical protein
MLLVTLRGFMGSRLVEGRFTELEPADPDANLEEPGLKIGMWVWLIDTITPDDPDRYDEAVAPGEPATLLTSFGTPRRRSLKCPLPKISSRTASSVQRQVEQLHGLCHRTELTVDP